MTARTMLLSDEEMIRESYGKHMVRHLYEAERNRLMDEIDRLATMLPKWVDHYKAEYDDLIELGWTVASHYGKLRLMVPPIPLPEKHEEKGSE